ncbi:MAG TPA: glycosyltransferase [Longimicrobiales bacterium]|nr:glycosyltransferase [Longimicrobiales bacterium]
MAKIVDVASRTTLYEYGEVAELAGKVRDLRTDAERLVPEIRGRRVWMVNSTAHGGGVAEMLPTEVSLLRELGVDARWVVMEATEPAFFPLTKRLHNMLHAAPGPPLTPADRELYESVSRENAQELLRLVTRDDILVIHDPQPMGAGAMVKQELGLPTIWRCHIGVDVRSPEVEAAWAFLEPYARMYDRALFTASEYVPGYLSAHSEIMYPALDPLSHKNRDLSLHHLVGTLCASALAVPYWPLVAPEFRTAARRLQPDGTFASATLPEDLGLIGRPIISEVSRWDRLKGFPQLMEGFRRMKLRAEPRHVGDSQIRLRLRIVRLVLAGPDPAAVQDDPEALGVLTELKERFRELEPPVQRDVAILALPMESRPENALMVNAIQRASTIVAQNSLREGFGLTVAEAMFKRRPVLGNRRAVGVRLQVRDGVDGRLVEDPEDPTEIADVMEEMLAHDERREAWGRAAQRRAYDKFLIFSLLSQWLDVFARVAHRRSTGE